MIKNIKKLFNIAAGLVIGSLILWNCEPEADQLGSQFFQNGADAIQEEIPIIAYNIKNDTVRTDASRLQKATLGAFYEPQLGLQKSSYITQVRLSSYDPDFGANPMIDSAVLAIRPEYATDSVKTVTAEDYIFPDGAVPAKKVINTYPILKYGKSKINNKTLFNINIHEVTDFLRANNEKVMSNKDVAIGNLIGTKTFDGYVNSINITKDSDNSTLLERDASLRIPLDINFFQLKIFNKAGSNELSDVATFIRYFKGIKISVEENDGYIFKFNPDNVSLILYYKKDKVENNVTTRVPATYALNLGDGNVHFNHIENNIVGSAFSQAAIQDTINGSLKIFAQGMGGPGIGIKISDSTIAKIKEKYKNDRIGIISAKIRLYTDPVAWNNKYEKPQSFVVKQRKINNDHTFTDLNTFLEDISTLAYSGNYNLVRTYDLGKAESHYDIGITQTLKNVIEKEAKFRHFALNVGTYTLDAAGNLLGLSFPDQGPQNFNTRAFTPNRAVFIGTDKANKNSAKLILTYGKK